MIRVLQCCLSPDIPGLLDTWCMIYEYGYFIYDDTELAYKPHPHCGAY